MIRRKIFKRKKRKFSFYTFFMVLFILIISSVFIIYNKNNFIEFVVEENKTRFYIIPPDKKGKIIPNKEIKILDYNYNLEKDIENNYINYDFSIQLYASSNYDNILVAHNNFAKNSTIIEDNIFIVVLKHNLGFDYLLVYKNFPNRKEALKYCSQYLIFLENCLIVNMQNLN